MVFPLGPSKPPSINRRLSAVFLMINMKPKSWKSLPAPVLHRLLWDCDLDYCPYESSMAECVHQIECGNISELNEKMVDTAWKMMSPDSFRLRLEQERDSLKEQLRIIEEMLDNHRRFPV
jgi:hypothetical protein